MTAVVNLIFLFVVVFTPLNMEFEFILVKKCLIYTLAPGTYIVSVSEHTPSATPLSRAFVYLRQVSKPEVNQLGCGA